jgi:hypothetical protein
LPIPFAPIPGTLLPVTRSPEGEKKEISRQIATIVGGAPRFCVSGCVSKYANVFTIFHSDAQNRQKTNNNDIS